MKRISRHKILLAGDSFEHCCDQVHRFFDLTSLVIYDCIEAQRAESYSGFDADFYDQIDKAIARNREMVADLVSELGNNGVNNNTDLRHIEQGYVSKTLHILAHFLDGFVGIDSFFYNLLDDSHWLPESTAKSIQEQAGKYWLIHIDCYSATPEEAGILRL